MIEHNPFHTDLVIKNANIITMNPVQPQANAVVIQFGRIIVVGTNEQLIPFINHSKQVIDLEQNYLLPGFIDSHTHLASNGVDFTAVRLDETNSVEAALQKIEDRVNELNPGEWILGRGWDESKWTVKRFITGSELDHIAEMSVY